MTNVPTEIRDLWSDIYKLFDLHYKMPNTETAWNKFWEQAKQVYTRHGSEKRIVDMVCLVADMISDRMVAEDKT